jgi:hypothetical protein
MKINNDGEKSRKIIFEDDMGEIEFLVIQLFKIY